MVDLPPGKQRNDFVHCLDEITCCLVILLIGKAWRGSVVCGVREEIAWVEFKNICSFCHGSVLSGFGLREEFCGLIVKIYPSLLMGE